MLRNHPSRSSSQFFLFLLYWTGLLKEDVRGAFKDGVEMVMKEVTLLVKQTVLMVATPDDSRISDI